MNSQAILVLSVICGSLAGPLIYQISTANKHFTSDLYNVIAEKKPDEDIFFSPLGIHTVLSMLYPGAGQETKTVLANALHLSGSPQNIQGYGNLLDQLNSVQNVTLHVVNKVFLHEQYKFQENYRTIIQENFHSDVDSSLNFGLDSEGAAQAVNSWVSDKTSGRIPTLFEAEDFNNDTRLVLLNAIYFKGNWADKFDKVDTRTEPFYVRGETERLDVQMMHRQGFCNYKNDAELDARVLELPFNGDYITMTIVLPRDISGIDLLERQVQRLGIDSLFRNLENERIKVALPKFKLETKIDLQEPLTDMGLGLLFDEQKCNLQNMIDADEHEQLYVSKAIQKAFIEVNEEGAEATAATGSVVSLLRSGSIYLYENFYADHPFLVVLRKGDTILFYGKIVNPVSGDDDVAPRYEPDRAQMADIEYDM